MAMRRYLDTVLAHRVVNKLIMLRRQPMQAFLDYVVAVQIFDQCHHVGTEGGDHCLRLA